MSESTNDITALRGILFEQLRALKSGATEQELAVAKAKNEIAQTIVNSAKVEVDAMRVMGGDGTGFIPALAAPTPGSGSTSHPRPGVTVHRIK